MTLMEMLVSVSILTVMILAFSTVLVQSQRVISVSQTSRRSHAMAFAIARVIRQDFRRATQNGFLAICNRNDGVPLLVFTTAGATQGTISDVRGSAGLACYSTCANLANNTTPPRYVLWHPLYVLGRPSGVSPVTTVDFDTRPTKDYVNAELGKIAMLPREPNPSVSPIAISDLAPKIMNWVPGNLRVPAQKVSQIDSLWQALVSECSELTVTWTDGEMEPAASGLGAGMRWFGVDPRRPAALGGAVKTCAASGISGVEIVGSGLAYYALWTGQNQNNWPRAVKIRFTIYEKGMPAEFRGTNGQGGMEYEVICNIGE